MPSGNSSRHSAPAPGPTLGSNLISIINEIHDALNKLDIKATINLPQIAVVGSQSSGKSSVLEALVGRDFLPRGSGIVTRCPAVLKLYRTGPGSIEYGVFDHKPNEKFSSFSKIRDEIDARTHSIAGDRAISSRPISLAIFSPQVLDLTLIDLPGLVSTAMGDQPADIDRQIKDMIMHHIRPANTIILAITPANADLANSVSLKAARMVDPSFDRTIGVLTKLDIMDQGTDALDILEGRTFPLRHRWHAVMNRSQKAINENTSMEQARKDETEFFMTHPRYSHLAYRLGTGHLARTMSDLLFGHIQRSLPELRDRIDKLIRQTRRKQDELGMNEETMDPASRCLTLFNAYSEAVKHAIEGTRGIHRSGEAHPQHLDQLQGGARLDFIFHENFASFIRSHKAGPQLTKEKLRAVIRNCSGIQSNLFPSDRAFLTLAREQVLRLEDPSLKCVTFVSEELRKICSTCGSVLDRFPTLRSRVLHLAFTLISDFIITCEKYIKTQVKSEQHYINVNHPQMQQLVLTKFSSQNLTSQQPQQPQQQPQQGAGQPSFAQNAQQEVQKSTIQHAQQTAMKPFHNLAKHIPSLPSRGGNHPQEPQQFEMPSVIHLGGELSSRESAEHDTLREMIEAYFSIVKESIIDQVTKHINFSLVHQLCTNLNKELMRQLYKEGQMKDLVAEPPEIINQRKASKQMLTCLLKAQASLDKVKSLRPSDLPQ